MSRKIVLVAAIMLTAVAVSVGGFYVAYRIGLKRPVVVGVLLPLTGPHAQGDGEAIRWATERINETGGIGGRRLELVFSDTGDAHTGDDLKKLAAPMLADHSIAAVIGPWNSEGMMELAPLFIEKQKLLISPSATSDELFRAFAGTHYVWRTCQSDIAQARTILHLLKVRGVTSVSLLSEEGPYGATFRNWIPFYANEMGMQVCALSVYPAGAPDISDAVDDALAGGPQYLICASMVEDAATIKRELDSRGDPPRMFVTDGAVSQQLLAALGTQAGGMEFTSLADDPATGYDTEYREKYGAVPMRSSSTSYDALLVAAFTSARRQYANGGFWKYLFRGGEDLYTSFWMVVHGNVLQVDDSGTNTATKTSWDRPEEAIKLFLEGKAPDIAGATGPLEYDWIKGVDPLHTFYQYGVTEFTPDGPEFKTLEIVDSDESLGAGMLPETASAGCTTASDMYRQEFTDEVSGVDVGPRRGLKAVIVATSAGWENYRHQANALGLYQVLKQNGVGDDDIVLMTVDDLANAQANHMKGNVHWVEAGPNVREGAEVDYSGECVTAQNLLKVLKGEEAAGSPVVLDSGADTDVLLYVIGHGSPGSIRFHYGGSLAAEQIASAIDEMRASNRFRRMLFIEDTCYGESIGAQIDTSGVAYLCASSTEESAYGCNYDERIDAWLSEEFSFSLLSALGGEDGLTLDRLYNTLYKEVPGSHVKMLNYQTFGGVSRTQVKEFTAP